MTVTVARRVAPGREAEFEGWAERLTRAASQFPGFLGAGLLRPGHVGEEWHVVYRFASGADLAGWERSAIRARLLADAQDLLDTTAVHRISGLETWFELPGKTAPAPPRWKMFVVSAIAIFSLQLLLRLLLDRVDAGWVLPLRVAAGAVPVTALMTWLVMPRLSWLLQSWLYASRHRGRHRGSP